MQSDLYLLLVDDNPRDRQLVIRELEREFTTVRYAEPLQWRDFEEALAGEPFDLVITDYQVRWTTGLEVLRTVRQKWSHCPVIMFTATGSEEIAVEAMKDGLDDYIIKSVDHLVRLRAAVRRALEQAAAAEHAESLEQRLANLLATLTVGVFRSEPGGRLLETNEAFRRLLQIHPERDIHDYHLGQYFCDSREAQLVEMQLREDGQLRNHETRFVREDSNIIWVALQMTLQEEADGLQVVDGIIEDISARKDSEEALRQTEADLAHMARIAAMGELLAGIAHEVNQPLNAIANYAVACLKKLESLPHDDLSDLSDWIGQINEQATRTAAIIQGMRQLASRQTSRQSEVEMNALLEETVNLLRFEFRQQEARLQWELAASLPRLVVDRIQIQQVIVNLLQNALESMEGKPPAERVVTIRTRQTDQHVEVAVVDCGAGLGDSRSDQLCQPFVTSKTQGLGMGLPVSMTIIRAHGGNLWGENHDGGGAIFRFTLPIHRENGT